MARAHSTLSFEIGGLEDERVLPKVVLIVMARVTTADSLADEEMGRNETKKGEKRLNDQDRRILQLSVRVERLDW